MLTACLQPLTVTTGTKGKVRPYLTQCEPLSPILFLLYIDEIGYICREPTEREVQASEIGRSEFSLTAKKIIIHTP